MLHGYAKSVRVKVGRTAPFYVGVDEQNAGEKTPLDRASERASESDFELVFRFVRLISHRVLELASFGSFGLPCCLVEKRVLKDHSLVRLNFRKFEKNILASLD